mgnify:FL=1
MEGNGLSQFQIGCMRYGPRFTYYIRSATSYILTVQIPETEKLEFRMIHGAQLKQKNNTVL